MKINIKTHPKNFLLVSYKIGSNFSEQAKRMETKSPRRFRTKLKLLNSQIECYLRVSYKEGGFNDGFYKSKDNLLLVFEAFCEK